MNDFALGLGLKRRLRATQKWTISAPLSLKGQVTEQTPVNLGERVCQGLPLNPSSITRRHTPFPKLTSHNTVKCSTTINEFLSFGSVITINGDVKHAR